MAEITALHAFLLAFDAYRAASKVAHDARWALVKDSSWKPEFAADRYEEAGKDSEVQRLEAESMRLYHEVQASSHIPIAANFEAFGLEDPTVVGVLRFRSGEDAGCLEAKLSELCALRSHGIVKRLELDAPCGTIEFRVKIFRDGAEIGFIDSDGDFDCAVGTLRQAIGYKLATDGGRERLVLVDLEAATKRVLDVVRNHGTSSENFFGPYQKVVQEVFAYNNGSRFADGYCGAMTVVWRAATRELGTLHEGYSFMY